MDNGFILLKVHDGEEVLVSGLRPFTYYTFFVQAVGGSGLIGPSSTTVFQRTSAVAVDSVRLSDDNVEAMPQTVTLILPSLNFTTGPLL